MMHDNAYNLRNLKTILVYCNTNENHLILFVSITSNFVLSQRRSTRFERANDMINSRNAKQICAANRITITIKLGNIFNLFFLHN